MSWNPLFLDQTLLVVSPILFLHCKWLIFLFLILQQCENRPCILDKLWVFLSHFIENFNVAVTPLSLLFSTFSGKVYISIFIITFLPLIMDLAIKFTNCICHFFKPLKGIIRLKFSFIFFLSCYWSWMNQSMRINLFCIWGIQKHWSFWWLFYSETSCVTV